MSAHVRMRHFAEIDAEESLRIGAKKDEGGVYDADRIWDTEATTPKRNFTVPALHEKTKTRPKKPSSSGKAEVDIQMKQLNVSALLPISVSSRALAVFKFMFRKSPEESGKGV